MIHSHARKMSVCAALVVAGMFAGMQDADAAQRRLKFDPAYGAPFTDLGWNGEAIVDYGTCDGPGDVSNLFGSCAGQMSFTSATVNLYNTTTNAIVQTIAFTGSLVAQINFDSANEPTKVWSGPFNPVQGNGAAESQYGGQPAWFSLIFVGEYAQLFWFEKDPGIALKDPLVFPYFNAAALTYAGCYVAGPGENQVGRNTCGLSSNLNGAGAKFTVTAVPEPETYAMMLAGLGALAFVARRRRRERQ